MGKGGKPSKPAVKSKGSEGQRSWALTKKIEKAKENPFDEFSNGKKKHEVLNRRVKGEDRNVGRAREKAIEERRKRLLGDHQASKKANVFDDKRFGEADATMSLEDNTKKWTIHHIIQTNSFIKYIHSLWHINKND